MNKLPIATEAEVQKACLAILAARGILCFRSNSRMFKVPGKGGRDRLMRMGLGAGSCDLVGVMPDGRFLGLEIKREGAQPTREQIAWMIRVNIAGGLAFWVDSPDGLILALDAIDRAHLRGQTVSAMFGPEGDTILTIQGRR